MRCNPCKRLREYFEKEARLAEERKDQLINLYGEEGFKGIHMATMNAKEVIFEETSRCK